MTEPGTARAVMRRASTALAVLGLLVAPTAAAEPPAATPWSTIVAIAQHMCEIDASALRLQSIEVLLTPDRYRATCRSPQGEVKVREYLLYLDYVPNARPASLPTPTLTPTKVPRIARYTGPPVGE